MSIQRGELLGSWQNVLDYIYGNGYRKLAMFLGDCDKCFANFIAWLCMIPFVCFTWNIWAKTNIALTIFSIIYLWVFGWFSSLVVKRKFDLMVEKRKKLEAENKTGINVKI